MFRRIKLLAAGILIGATLACGSDSIHPPPTGDLTPIRPPATTDSGQESGSVFTQVDIPLRTLAPGAKGAAGMAGSESPASGIDDTIGSEFQSDPGNQAATIVTPYGTASPFLPDTPTLTATLTSTSTPDISPTLSEPTEDSPTSTTAPSPLPGPDADALNFLIIISDDQRYDQMAFMPRVTKLLFDSGVTFPHAYVTTPQCCPSRSSILTGLYARRHGVWSNADDLYYSTVVTDLHRAGYYTGLVGKYLNSFPEDFDDPPSHPDFDYWVATGGGPTEALYYDPVMAINGNWTQTTGYQTFLLRDYALTFIAEADKRNQPFILIFAPFAPHKPALPAPGDELLYTDLVFTPGPAFNEADISDKPQIHEELLTEAEIAGIQRFRQNRLRRFTALTQA